MTQQRQEIEKLTWDDVVSGKSGNPAGDAAIIEMADNDHVIVVDRTYRYIPRRDSDGKWLLMPLAHPR